MSHAAMSVEEVKKHVKVYYTVFAVLLFCTVLTVAVSYLHLEMPLAITVALLIAAFKGSLVALFFMHLSAEKKVIYSVIALTSVFFLFVMMIGFF